MKFIPPADLRALTSKTITKSEYDKTINQIGEVTNLIWHYICNTSTRKLHWWAFRNDVDLGSGNGSTGGNFDPKKDHEFIHIIGDRKNINSDSYPYNDGFPTDLLTTPNWDKIIDKAISEWKKERTVEVATAKSIAMAKKANYAKLKASVKHKLTKDELKVITFKPLEKTKGV